MTTRFLFAAAVATVASVSFASDWTFANGTLTDGDWTFAATVKSGTTYIHHGYEDAWRPYAADGVLNGKNSTWAADYVAPGVADLSLRKLLVVDLPPENTLIILF